MRLNKIKCSCHGGDCEVGKGTARDPFSHSWGALKKSRLGTRPRSWPKTGSVMVAGGGLACRMDGLGLGPEAHLWVSQGCHREEEKQMCSGDSGHRIGVTGRKEQGS